MYQQAMAVVGSLPGVRSRRLRLWLMAVGTIAAVLGVQSLMPAWRLFPEWAGELQAGAVLAVFLAALFCEYIDSSLGMGYGTTLTPLLLLTGFEPMQIVPAVLLSEFLTGLSAGLMHHHDGNIDLLRDGRARKTLLLLSALSTAGALAAVFVALHVSKFSFTLLIGLIIITMGVLILATLRRPIPYRPCNVVAIGAIAAFNKGISGGGYGPLVTAGQVVSGLPPKNAVAITSLAESLTCLVGLSAYVVMRGQPLWELAVPLTVGAMLSVPLATATVRRLPDHTMRSAVGILTGALGITALFKLFS